MILLISLAAEIDILRYLWNIGILWVGIKSNVRWSLSFVSSIHCMSEFWVSLKLHTHLHVPVVVRNFGESASDGTGIKISTLFAVDRLLNWERALTIISTLEWACFSMWDSTHINGLICVLKKHSLFDRVEFCRIF